MAKDLKRAKQINLMHTKQDVLATLLAFQQVSQIVDKTSSARIAQLLDSAIVVLDQVNHERKQLLTVEDKVKLLVSLVSGEILPAAKATQYIQALDNNLDKVNFMSAGLKRSVVEVDMRNGLNFSGMDANGLKRIVAGLDVNVNSVYGIHDQLQLKNGKNGPNPDENQNSGPRL